MNLCSELQSDNPSTSFLYVWKNIKMANGKSETCLKIIFILYYQRSKHTHTKQKTFFKKRKHVVLCIISMLSIYWVIKHFAKFHIFYFNPSTLSKKKVSTLFFLISVIVLLNYLFKKKKKKKAFFFLECVCAGVFFLCLCKLMRLSESLLNITFQRDIYRIFFLSFYSFFFFYIIINNNLFTFLVLSFITLYALRFLLILLLLLFCVTFKKWRGITLHLLYSFSFPSP